jgi:hypothetical protein
VIEGVSPRLVGVSGEVECLSMADRCVVDASQSGLRVRHTKVSRDAELYGLDPVVLDYQSLVALEEVEHLSLWVNPKAWSARQSFSEELSKVRTERRRSPTVGLDSFQELIRLRERRTRLLALAVAKRQDGHTLSLLREAEKQTRTALSGWTREGILLRMSQLFTGHGERVFRPLFFWVFISLGLICLQVGDGRFFSSTLWTDRWWQERMLYVLRFGFPGSSFLDVEPVGGLWGALAKLNSLLFLGAALNALRKVARGS